jgi:hypothetical protein
MLQAQVLSGTCTCNFIIGKSRCDTQHSVNRIPAMSVCDTQHVGNKIYGMSVYDPQQNDLPQRYGTCMLFHDMSRQHVDASVRGVPQLATDMGAGLLIGWSCPPYTGSASRSGVPHVL